MEGKSRILSIFSESGLRVKAGYIVIFETHPGEAILNRSKNSRNPSLPVRVVYI